MTLTPSFLQREYWIFDLDGTLTRPVHDFPQMRSQLGMAPDADILGVIAAMEGPRKREMTRKLDELELHYARLAQPAEGVLHLLLFLYRRGVKLGILTRNSRDIALRSLQAIGADRFFHPDWVLGRDEARPKPEPDGILRLLDDWGISAEQAVMVGDFRFDMETGKAAGTATVHVAEEGAMVWPDITDLRVSSLTHLLDLLY